MKNCDLRTLVPILEESTLTKTEFLQTMRQTKARTATPAPPEVIPPPDTVAAALQRAGIPTDAPYYAGAFRNVEQVLSGSSPIKKGFRLSQHSKGGTRTAQNQHTHCTGDFIRHTREIRHFYATPTGKAAHDKRTACSTGTRPR